MPNQQNWIYNWIFTTVLPILIGQKILCNIKIIISDGDSQEFHGIDEGIRLHYPQVYRVRCGWHIIDRGWLAHILGKSAFPCAQVEYDKISNNIKQWLFSFMSDACETMQEYNYSKFQLTRYIKSDYVTSTLGYVFAENVLRWLRKYVFVHESYFLFCLRKHIRHYKEYSN